MILEAAINENVLAAPMQSRKKLLLLVNPYSGKGEIKSHLLTIVDLFVKNNYEVTVHTTQSQGEIPPLVKRVAGQYHLLVACGGDGTLNETVTGLMQAGTATPLGYIPAGTVNDFASSLNISKDMPAAAANIINGRLFGCDVGMFGQRYFTYIAAFGAFTQAAYQTPQQYKNMLGKAAYMLQGVTMLPYLTSYHMKITCKGHYIEDDFVFGMVSNSLSVAGMRIDGRLDVSLSDGLLEVLLVKWPKNPWELQAVLTALLQQEADSQYFYAFRTNQLHFSTVQEVQWTLDGEFGGAVSEGDICVSGQQLHIMAAPAQHEAAVEA